MGWGNVVWLLAPFKAHLGYSYELEGLWLWIFSPAMGAKCRDNGELDLSGVVVVPNSFEKVQRGQENWSIYMDVAFIDWLWSKSFLNWVRRTERTPDWWGISQRNRNESDWFLICLYIRGKKFFKRI